MPFHWQTPTRGKGSFDLQVRRTMALLHPRRRAQNPNCSVLLLAVTLNFPACYNQHRTRWKFSAASWTFLSNKHISYFDFFRCAVAALPADCHDQGKALAPLFNKLVDKISRDGPWLREVLADVLVRREPMTIECARSRYRSTLKRFNKHSLFFRFRCTGKTDKVALCKAASIRPRQFIPGYRVARQDTAVFRRTRSRREIIFPCLPIIRCS